VDWGGSGGDEWYKAERNKGKRMNYRWSCPAVSGHFCFDIFSVAAEKGLSLDRNFF
jgi:hypothetical protein